MVFAYRCLVVPNAVKGALRPVFKQPTTKGWRSLAAVLPWRRWRGIDALKAGQGILMYSAYGAHLGKFNWKSKHTGWCPSVISWFINPINYSSIYVYLPQTIEFSHKNKVTERYRLGHPVLDCGYVKKNGIYINEYSRGFCRFCYGFFLSEGNLTVTCRHLESLSWTVDLMVTLW